MADALLPEIAQKLHPAWHKNEAAYLAARDQLLGHYQGQWIGFAEGAVVASTPAPLEVFLAIQQSRQHPLVVRVGHEDEPWYGVRRGSFPYEAA